MSLHRFFATAAWSGGPVPLTETDVHHAVDVLRIGPGDRVAVVTPDGSQHVALVTELTEHGVAADVESSRPPAFRPRVTLVQAVCRRERMELVVQKATELGVSAILPVITARCVVRLDGAKAAERAERWRRMAGEAAKQAQLDAIPLVRDPIPISRLDLPALGTVLLPWEEAQTGTPGIGQALDPLGVTSRDAVGVVIGPEGGFEPAEVAALVAAGARTVSLGDTILRTETAGIVASALVLYELGGLGGQPRG